jgi:hypothetical protein
MAEYKLWHFIEGEDVVDSVTISEDEKVDQLKREIQNQWRNSYCNDVDAGMLFLLKVCHTTSILLQPAPTFLTFRLT